MLATMSLLALGSCSRSKPVQNARGKIVRAGKISVFDLKVGNCAVPPDKADVELTEISVMPCTERHTLEVFALPRYTGSQDFPGNEELEAEADIACLNQFEKYLGAPYTDSKLFFTHLTPSARSWGSEADRRTICFVTTTGKPLLASVKGSKK
ncbi:MAG: hypothetical protein JWM47_1398 [Acidimicrobiales bacterium]|nr:hypothetical protein [Acidimicrobiales bacterium]